MTEKGKFITATFGSRFMFSMLNQEIDLERGNYIFMIDPIWDPSADLCDSYKDVLVDVYAPECVDLEKIDDEVGMLFLENAMKDAA